MLSSILSIDRRRLAVHKKGVSTYGVGAGCGKKTADAKIRWQCVAQRFLSGILTTGGLAADRKGTMLVLQMCQFSLDRSYGAGCRNLLLSADTNRVGIRVV